MNIGTKVGRAKHTRVMPGGSLEQEPSSVFVGSKLEDHRGAFILDYPMSKGCVKDDQGWESMERIWEVCTHHYYYYLLHSSILPSFWSILFFFLANFHG